MITMMNCSEFNKHYTNRIFPGTLFARLYLMLYFYMNLSPSNTYCYFPVFTFSKENISGGPTRKKLKQIACNSAALYP